MSAHIKKLGGSNLGWPIVASLIVLYLFTAVSCRAPQSTSAYRGAPESVPYGVEPAARWREREHAQVRATVPEVPKAEMVNDDQLCATCHESYVKHHQTNIHQKQSCETCHGPASEHIRTRGKEPGLIRSFKQMKPAERSETCLQCHEDNSCQPGKEWRISTHANAGVSCTDCHTGHYTVPPGTKSTDLTKSEDRYDTQIQLVRLPALTEETLPPANQLPASRLEATSDQTKSNLALTHADSRKMGAITPQICYRCHANMMRQRGDRPSAPDLRSDSNRLHDLPRSPRQNPSRDAHRSMPQMPRHGLTYNGVAFIDTRALWSGLCRLPQSASELTRSANS